MNWLKEVLLCPQGRLEANFPWTGKQATGKYFKSVWEFAKGSFVVPLLFLGTIYALVFYPKLQMLFLEPGTTAVVLATAMVLGAGIPVLLAWWRKRRGVKPPHPGRLALISLIGGLMFVNLLVVGMNLLDPHYYKLMDWIVKVMTNEDGQPSMTFLMGMSTISFVMGFGMQMRFINRCLREDNLSLVDSMALHVRNRQGRNWFFTAWNVIWPVAIAYVVINVLGDSIVYVMGQPHQGTVDMARQATGGNFLLFALMAAIGAPLFEELVFRGFLFQVLRSSLRRPLDAVALATMPTSGSFLWARVFWVRADNWVRSTSHAAKAGVHSILSARPDLTAIIVSSLFFALMHMQFHPTTLVLLFVLGCVHAELYRRTGSLWCSIMLHCLNNSLEVIKIGMGS